MDLAAANRDVAASLLASAVTGQRKAARAGLEAAERVVKQAEKAKAEAEKQQQKLATMPREIDVRDTTRDSIVTCMKLTVQLLLEFVLKEYFGGARMEIRTYIEAFMHLSVTVRERGHEVVYEIHENPRSSGHTKLIRAACVEVTKRELRAGGKRLRFVTVGGGPSRTIDG